MKIKDGKLLYHLTTLDVLESIAKNGLLSRGELNKRNLNFVDTANHDILAGRERLDLSNYIPFHFHIHTAYDTSVKQTHKDKIFIYLRLNRSYAIDNGFKILSIHPTSLEQPQLFDYIEGFSKIDWSIMEMTISDAEKNSIDKRLHKQIRMAECLSPNSIPICDFQSILVKDEQSRKYAKVIFSKYKITKAPFIDIDKDSKYF